MTWIQEMFTLAIGGFLGWAIQKAFGQEHRAKLVQFFIFLMAAFVIVDHAGSAVARVSDHVDEVRQDVRAVQDAGNKINQAADAIQGIKGNSVLNFGASDKPLGTSLLDKIWPFRGGRFSVPVAGTITQGFNEHNHGLDIACNEGTPIRAARAGSVAINSDGIYGNYVLIDHGGGWQTLYAHCSKIGVKVGQHVFEGDVIALAGQTGNADGSHLHFEIRKDGKAVDPMQYLSKRG